MASNRSSKAAASRLPPGTRLNGVFEIDRRIATGGMAELYRGRAVETGDPVAIKVMRADLAGNISALAALRKEASTLHGIKHDAVVRHHVFASDPVARLHYLAMEFVDGRPLRDLLGEGPLTFEAVRALQQRLAAGLDAAHQHGIIHRDVSPDNILIPNGDVARAKIINFGIARSTGGGGADGTIIIGSFAGKYSYLSPEQLGLFGGNVTAKADIYSLGLVLAECLSGQPIDMGGSQFEVIEKRRVLPNLGAVDLRYRALLEHMLQPDPHDRPQSMAAVAAWRPDVAYRARRPAPLRGRRGRGAGAGGAEPARSTNASPGRERLARNIAIAAGVLTLLAGFAGVAFFLLYPLPPAPPPLEPAASATDAIPPGGGPQRTQLDNDTARRIVRYVNSYQGGDCFFAAVPVADGHAGIDAYAATVAPFEAFQSDFKRANGFDAAINPQRISQPQCAAISFLSRLRGSPGSGPRLDNVAASLRSGTALSGAVGGAGDRHVELLLIADDGLVYNITSLLMPGTGERKTFSLGIRLAEPGAPRPQLIIAVASSVPLAAFKPPQAALGTLGAADEVFPRAVNEARQSGQLLNASVKYFRLEN
jgi:hypothetical protein